MENKLVQSYWDRFLTTQTRLKKVPELEEAWSFGDTPEMADELVALVLSGQKTATSSAHATYEKAGELLPEPSSFSIILDGQGQPRCVVETTLVKVVPFFDITESDAAKEGEGDLSLTYWRDVHEKFWRGNLDMYDLVFSEEMLVVFEEFKVVYQ